MDRTDALLRLERLEELFDLNRRSQLRNRRLKDRSNPFEEFDDEQFSARFRFPKSSIIHFISLIEEKLPTSYSHSLTVPSWLQVLIAMRFYGTGAQQILVGDYAGIHQSTVSRIVKRISTAIAKLRQRFISFPTSDELSDVRRKFYQIADFPGVIGSIDCTHVPIQCPSGPTAELFRNRKGFFSVNVQVIGDADLSIRNIVARWPGSTHDARVFENSNVCCQLEDRNGNDGYLLGDSGYPCRTYLLTPFANPRDSHERRFNFAHAKTRTTVERLFGVWKRRFPCVGKGLRTKMETSLTIIIATAVLHNYARRHHLPEAFEENEQVSPSWNEETDVHTEHGTISGFALRRSLAQRFQ